MQPSSPNDVGGGEKQHQVVADKHRKPTLQVVPPNVAALGDAPARGHSLSATSSSTPRLCAVRQKRRCSHRERALGALDHDVADPAENVIGVAAAHLTWQRCPCPQRTSPRTPPLFPQTPYMSSPLRGEEPHGPRVHPTLGGATQLHHLAGERRPKHLVRSLSREQVTKPTGTYDAG